VPYIFALKIKDDNAVLVGICNIDVLVGDKAAFASGKCIVNALTVDKGRDLETEFEVAVKCVYAVV